MTQIVGVFEQQGHAVEAIKMLKEQGISVEKIRVIARNEDQAGRVDSETEVNVEKIEDQDRELNGYRYAEPNSGLNAPVIPLAAASPTYLGDTLGNAVPGAPAGYPGGVIGESALDPINWDAKQKLRDLGFNDSDSKQYSEYLERGNLLLLVDSEPSDEAAAEAALRRSGASVVR
ncbi:MAG: hypothetical protein K0R67_203 [Paenibacillus sp.]|jgi:uncharacterized protein YoaH (UPF0181 family)|nr:hypothetical protein [Paenibacillus sp.]